MSYFYAIRMKETNFVKLGKSDNVKSRLIELQCGNPVELETEHTFSTDDPHDIESRCLRKLRKYRVRGEWYEINKVELATNLAQIYADHVEQYPLREVVREKVRAWKVTLIDGSDLEITSRLKNVRFGALVLVTPDKGTLRFEKGTWVSVERVYKEKLLRSDTAQE